PAATPVLSPGGGTFTSSVAVTLTDSTSGATIYYTTDGSTPTTASTPYSGPITVTTTQTIKAIAAASGYATSALASATYTIRVAAPTFSPPSGTYSQPQSIAVNDTTGGATIYYTTDGSTPTKSSAMYTGPITVTPTTTLKALAAKTPMADSIVATAIYALPASARDYAVGVGPASVAVGDLNGDGKVDLVVANSQEGTVSVLLGNGDGTFQPARSFEAGGGGGPVWVIVVDINGDGKQDVVLADANYNSARVLLGNGDGTLQPSMNFPSGGNLPRSIAVAEFNGDGKLDVAVTHFYSNNVTLLLGNGDGTFQPALAVETCASDMYLILGVVDDGSGHGKL